MMSTREEILWWLEQGYELTADQLADKLDKTVDAIESSIRLVRKKTGADVIKVSRYSPVRGGGGRPRPVFAMGPGRDARMPDLSTPENVRATRARYRLKKKLRDAGFYE